MPGMPGPTYLRDAITSTCEEASIPRAMGTPLATKRSTIDLRQTTRYDRFSAIHTAWIAVAQKPFCS